MTLSIFTADSWFGFDFNNDEKWAPGRAFKGGSNAYLEFNGGNRIDIPNIWACVIDVASCMNISLRLAGTVNFVEVINLVHLHELCHTCDDGKAERYDTKNYSHTYYWNKILIPLSKIDSFHNFKLKEN